MDEAIPVAAASSAAVSAAEALLGLTRTARLSGPEELSEWLDLTARDVRDTFGHLAGLCEALRDAAPQSFHHPQLSQCARRLRHIERLWRQLGIDNACLGVM